MNAIAGIGYLGMQVLKIKKKWLENLKILTNLYSGDSSKLEKSK